MAKNTINIYQTPIDALFTRYALNITDFFSLLAIFPYPEGKMLWLHKYQVNYVL
jgi:hypothetical protein